MVDFAFRLGVMLAVSVGSAGFVLSVLAWQLFRGAPFGRALGVLVPFMGAFTVYHALLLLTPDSPMVVLGVESFAFVLVLVFVGRMVRLHSKRLRKSSEEVTTQ